MFKVHIHLQSKKRERERKNPFALMADSSKGIRIGHLAREDVWNGNNRVLIIP